MENAMTEVTINPELQNVDFLSIWNKNWYETAKQDDRLMFRAWIKSILRTQRMNVSFKKADGSIRQLHCSLHPELLPEVVVTENTQIKKENTEVLAVFDLDKQAWRSFRVDSIQDFSFNLGDLHV